MRLLITGGMGFIGSNYVKYHLNNHLNDDIVVLDNLTYAGREDNLKELLGDFEFIKDDICNLSSVQKAMKNCDQIIHFAAESHVDRSILNVNPFLQTNICGSNILFEVAKEYDIERFIQISTDEVYGSTTEGSFKENDPLLPSSPYSASKAGSDLLAYAYYNTYNLPVIITRSSNNYGPYQNIEKFIPTVITKALMDEKIPVYGNGLNVRDWMYVIDNCAGIDQVRMKGSVGEIYNIGSHTECSNIDIVHKILELLDKPNSLINYVKDRPGHDFRYSVNNDKITAIGWKPSYELIKGLELTINWYQKNPNFWNASS